MVPRESQLKFNHRSFTDRNSETCARSNPESGIRNRCARRTPKERSVEAENSETPKFRFASGLRSLPGSVQKIASGLRYPKIASGLRYPEPLTSRRRCTFLGVDTEILICHGASPRKVACRKDRENKHPAGCLTRTTLFQHHHERGARSTRSCCRAPVLVVMTDAGKSISTSRVLPAPSI